VGTQVHESDVIPGLGLRASREASLAEVLMCDVREVVQSALNSLRDSLTFDTYQT